MRRLLHFAILFPWVCIVTHNMDAHTWEMLEVEITQCLHPAHLVQNGIPTMLHFVHLKKQEPPRPLYVEVDSCTLPRRKSIRFHNKITGNVNMHRHEDGRDCLLVCFASWPLC